MVEDNKVNVIACSVIAALVVIVVVARLSLGLSNPFYSILGAALAVILAVFAYLLLRRSYNRRRILLETKLATQGVELRIEYSFLRKVAGIPVKFRLTELEEATDNFQALLGQGASASVYKGILSDGTSVAVKRIGGETARGEKEFRSEVAAISSVQHINLVRLLGYCIVPNGPRFLIYDFIPNGSLDCWIFPRPGEDSRRRRRVGGCLSWALRYQVAVDVAKALAYLHHDCRSRILHLDVKPENILLDENYRGIVGDFGLSKLMGKDESRVVTTIRGTRGYLAPEWLLDQGVSEKSDIYSYGMVVLEMIGGTRNVSLIQQGDRGHERKWQYYPRIVSERLREGRLMEAVDRRLIDAGGVEEAAVKRLVCVALWCIQERATLRPTMTRVVEMLEGMAPVDEPPVTSMIVVDLLCIDEENAVEGAAAARLAALRATDRNGAVASICSVSSSVLSPR